ncbi:MAG: LamG domain-containing protein [Candidatus Cryptobacteroides sp.]
MKKYFALCAAALALCAMSCTKDNNQDGKVDTGKKQEITVAKDALVAYLPFESEEAAVGGLTLAGKGNTSEANFVQGRNGKSFTGGENQYLLYDLPAESPIKTLKAFTLSAWIKHQEVPQEQAAVPMFFQITKSDNHFWGNLSLTIDRCPAGAGYLTYKTAFRHSDAGEIWKAWNDNYTECYPADRWNHLIFIYDNVKSEYHVYVNGAEVTPENDVPCVMADQPSGDLTFANAEQIAVGVWMPKLLDGATDEWMGWLDGGQIDELRLYNRALSAEEADALYKAEIANID